MLRTLALPFPKEKAPAPLARETQFKARLPEAATAELMFNGLVWPPVTLKLTPGVPLFRLPGTVSRVKNKLPATVPSHWAVSPAAELGSVSPDQLVVEPRFVPVPLPPSHVRVV